MAELSLSSFDTTPQFKLQATCPCKVLDCYDGDTVTVALQLGDGRLARFTVRLLGIDTPERRPKRSRGQPGLAALEKQAALQVRARLLQLLLPEECPIELRQVKKRKAVRQTCSESHRLVHLDFHDFDKYGRVLGALRVLEDGPTVNDTLVAEGLARIYDGGTRQPWTREELERIVAAD